MQFLPSVYSCVLACVMLSVFDNSYCLAHCLCMFELLFQSEPHHAVCLCSLADQIPLMMCYVMVGMK